MPRISDKKAKPVSGLAALNEIPVVETTGWDNRPADWKVEARKRRALEPINNEPGDEWRD